MLFLLHFLQLSLGGARDLVSLDPGLAPPVRNGTALTQPRPPLGLTPYFPAPGNSSGWFLLTQNCLSCLVTILSTLIRLPHYSLRPFLESDLSDILQNGFPLLAHLTYSAGPTLFSSITGVSPKSKPSYRALRLFLFLCLFQSPHLLLISLVIPKTYIKS